MDIDIDTPRTAEDETIDTNPDARTRAEARRDDESSGPKYCTVVRVRVRFRLGLAVILLDLSNIQRQYSARAINSTRGVHLTVATLSKRCYRMAVGVMNKWAKGTYQRQPTTAVTQTLFYCLVGLKDEQDVFNVLQEFHNGSLKSKKEFDKKVNGIKKTAAEAENQRLSGEIDNLKKELDKSKKDLDKYQKDKEPHEATEPAPKSRKTLHNWEGKTITMGKMVAVVYSSPRQVYYGRVADIAEREGEQVVMVDFFKKARKSLVANGERQPVPPTFILDTDVQVVKNGETLSLSQGEDGRLKKKETQFWATGKSP
ncbi:ATP binding [Branchiostoma belcheri]|nr:ATP binding [Branchiostoma belcheri]